MGKPTAERKQEIIEAALTLAAELGVQKVTTQAIADRVGIAQPTVFRHFKTRDDIFAAAISWLANDMFAELEGYFYDAAPADERLRQLIATQLGYISRNKGLPRLLFSDRLHMESPELKQAVQKIMQGYGSQIARLISTGQQQGSFCQELDAEEGSRLITALIQGMVMRWSVFDFGFELEAEAEPLWRFISAALCTAGHE